MAEPGGPASRADGGRERFFVERYDTIDAIAAEWDQLALAVNASPFRRPAWIGSWWRSFGSGRLHVAALRDGHRQGRLAGLIPVQERFGRVSSPSNWHSPEFGMVATDGSAAAALAEHLFRARPVEVSMAFVCDTDEELGTYRTAAAAAGYSLLERRLEDSPYLETTGSWEEYSREKLSKGRRSHLRQARRRLEREGRLEFESVNDQGRLEATLDEAFAIEASGWKGERGTAIVSSPNTHRFYREVARWAAGEDSLRIEFLRLEGRGIAVMYLLEAGPTLYYLKGGYDPAFHASSPGMVLLESVVKSAFRSGTTRLDLCGGDDPYKLVFADELRRKVRLQAFSPSPLGMAARGAFAYGRPLARRAVHGLPLARRALAEARRLRSRGHP